jgi:hypothetical protein
LAYSRIERSAREPAPPIESKTALIFHVGARGNAGAVARRHLELLEGHVDHSTLAKLRLLISELVTRTATTVGRGLVHVSVTVSPRSVHANVHDEFGADTRRLDWGLFLVHRMADRSGVADGIWFELDLRPPHRA